MPVFLEKKLKREYPGDPHAVYGTLNKLGFMHGNKETAKGKRADKKHSAHEKALAHMKSVRNRISKAESY